MRVHVNNASSKHLATAIVNDSTFGQLVVQKAFAYTRDKAIFEQHIALLPDVLAIDRLAGPEGSVADQSRVAAVPTGVARSRATWIAGLGA